MRNRKHNTNQQNKQRPLSPLTLALSQKAREILYSFSLSGEGWDEGELLKLQPLETLTLTLSQKARGLLIKLQATTDARQAEK